MGRAVTLSPVKDKQLDGFSQLSHLYSAAAAVLREDDFAVRYLRGHEFDRRQLLKAAVGITAQALRLQQIELEAEHLISLSSDPARTALLEAAMASLSNDRLTGYEIVELLARTQRSVTDIAAPLIAELWSYAAFTRGLGNEEFSRQMCLAVGQVGASLDR